MANVVISVGQVDSVGVAVDNEVEASAVGIGDKLFIKGDKGDKGDPGDRGPQGVPGPQGAQGIQGPQGIPGNDGKDGKDGADGTNGTNGTDGVSPTVSVSTITGGHQVDVTDAGGTTSFNVMDGVNGTDGSDGTNGTDGTTFTPSVSAEGDISWTNDGGKTNPATVNIKGPQGDPGTTDFNNLSNKPNYALSAAVGGSAKNTEGIPYGTVDGTSTSTAFTATVPGVTELKDGTVVMLKNGVVTSAAGFTVNVNGLGAKPVYSNMAAATADTTIFNVNYTMLFVYDSTRVTGGCWICYRGYNSDTNTIGYQLRTNSTVLKTADKCRYYKLFFTSADGTHWVPAAADSTNSATSAKAVNQRKIDPFGRIAYTSATTSYAAEADIAATSLWSRYALTLGYSFNRTGAALTLTTKKPVYVKCAPQDDGSAIMDSTAPIVQALPNSDDGKIYIFLGIAYSATQVELYENHPVYYYKDSAIRLWTNAPKELPAVTSPTDDGKILRVVSGAWTAVSLPSASGVNF